MLHGEAFDLALVSSHHFSHISCDNALLIVRCPEDLPAHLSSTHAVAIVDSANSALRQALYARKLPALTCGRSSTDFFTLTSLTDDSAVISLSRPICAFDASEIDPFELPVSLPTHADPFELMAACAVLCMMGGRYPLPLKERWLPIA